MLPIKFTLKNTHQLEFSNFACLAKGLEILSIKSRHLDFTLAYELAQVAARYRLSASDPLHLAYLVALYKRQDNFIKQASISNLQDWLLTGMPIILHSPSTFPRRTIVLIDCDNSGFIACDPSGQYLANGWRLPIPAASAKYSYSLIDSLYAQNSKYWAHFLSLQQQHE